MLDTFDSIFRLRWRRELVLSLSIIIFRTFICCWGCSSTYCTYYGRFCCRSPLSSFPADGHFPTVIFRRGARLLSVSVVRIVYKLHWWGGVELRSLLYLKEKKNRWEKSRDAGDAHLFSPALGEIENCASELTSRATASASLYIIHI